MSIRWFPSQCNVCATNTITFFFILTQLSQNVYACFVIFHGFGSFMRIVPPSNVPCTLPRLPSIATFTHGLPTLLRIRPTPAIPAHSPPSLPRPPRPCPFPHTHRVRTNQRGPWLQGPLWAYRLYLTVISPGTLLRTSSNTIWMRSSARREASACKRLLATEQASSTMES